MRSKNSPCKMLNDLLDFTLKELSFEKDENCTVDTYASLIERFCIDNFIDVDLKSLLRSLLESLVQIPFVKVLDLKGTQITVGNLSNAFYIMPSQQRKHEYLIEGFVFSELNEVQWKILDLVASSKENGIPQVEISKGLQLDAKTTFYHLKRLNELEIVVKYPFIFKSASTNIWFHHKYDLYLSEESTAYTSQIAQSNVTFENIETLFRQKSVNSMSISALCQHFKILPRYRKRFRHRLSHFHLKGLIEKYISIDDNGKRIFCIRLAETVNNEPTENICQKKVFNFCSTFEKDLITLGMDYENGMYASTITECLMLKKKAAESIAKKFAADKSDSVPYVLKDENVGKEHRKKFILKDSFKPFLSNSQSNCLIENSKTIRLIAMRDYIEKQLIFENNATFHADIRKLHSGRHKMCSKTIKKDLNELLEEGFCYAFECEKPLFNGTSQKKVFILHSSQNVNDPNVTKRIESIKNKLYKRTFNKMEEVHESKHIKEMDIPDGDIFNETTDQVCNNQLDNSQKIKYWLHRSKNYGYVAADMQRAKLLHLYLWNRFNAPESFMADENIVNGTFPLSLFLMLVPIIEEFSELFDLTQSQTFSTCTLNDLPLELRIRICNNRSQSKFFDIVKTLIQLHLIEEVGSNLYKLSSYGVVILFKEFAATKKESDDFLLENSHDESSDNEIGNPSIQRQETNSPECCKTFNIRSDYDANLYWSTLEFLSLELSGSHDIVDYSLLHSSFITLDSSFIARLRKNTSWKESFLKDESTIDFLNSFVDQSRCYTPYRNARQLEEISTTLNIPVTKLKSFYYETEKKFNKTDVEDDESVDVNFYHDDNSPPEYYSRNELWTKKKDEILLVASTIVRDIASTTPLKFNWNGLVELFSLEIDGNFLRCRCSLLKKHMKSKVRIASCNWHELKAELVKTKFFNPNKRTLSLKMLIKILTMYEKKYAGFVPVQSTDVVDKRETVDWHEDLNTFLRQFSIVRNENMERNDGSLQSAATLGKKSLSDSIDEALSFKHTKYLMQTAHSLIPNTSTSLQLFQPNEELGCMDAIRIFLFNKNKSVLFFNILQFSQAIIQKSAEELIQLGTLSKISRVSDFTSLLSYQPGEKVKHWFAKFEEISNSFSNKTISNIYGVKSTDMRDDFLVDLLFSVALKQKFIKQFGSNILISNNSAEKFSKFAPTPLLLNQIQRDILKRGVAWKTDVEMELNVEFISMLQFIIIERLQRQPGISNDSLFASVSCFISFQDYHLFLCYLQSKQLVNIENENIFLYF